MEQKHVFDGFKHGEKAQGSLLADQIISVNSKLLQVALQNIEMPSNRWGSYPHPFLGEKKARVFSLVRWSCESSSGVAEIRNC